MNNFKIGDTVSVKTKHHGTKQGRIISIERYGYRIKSTDHENIIVAGEEDMKLINRKEQAAGRMICESSAEIRSESNNLFLLVEDWDESKALLKPDSPETKRINQLLEQLMDITSELDMIGQRL